MLCDREVGGCNIPTCPVWTGRERSGVWDGGMVGYTLRRMREMGDGVLSPGAQSKPKATKMAKAGHKVQ